MKLNVFSAIVKGIKLMGDIAEVATAIVARQQPDLTGIAGDLFQIVTEDLKVPAGNATPAKLAQALEDIAMLFLPSAS